MAQIRINREELKDKIHACWIGKNIGGTIGTPYECKTEMQDIHGFVTEKGEPLPNDDLDLQLVWLIALERRGPWNLDAAQLGEYWLTLIPPSWNEYGIGKANMKRGFMPPLSGEVANDVWKHSNGAWIRSEIWACLAPGYAGIARRYAVEDAMVDHGMGEGTIAEIFTATLESEAFFCKDIRKLIEHALAEIPADSYLARSVRLVLECYDAGEDYRKVREKVVELSRDLGWFEAPANVSFAVIGLLWGEGDFKKTMITAVNCGDDTDCTGATVGAILGIMNGTAGIPQDWSEYIGERIITKAVNLGYDFYFPKTCEELTERVMRMIPSVFRANGVYMEFTDGETSVEPEENRVKYGLQSDTFIGRAPYSFDINDSPLLRGRVSYEKEPILAGGETLRATVQLSAQKIGPWEPYWISVECLAPEGWSVKCPSGIFLNHSRRPAFGGTFEVEITAPEKVAFRNTVVLVLSGTAIAGAITVPLIIGG